MLELKKGAIVTCADKLSEGYKINEFALISNINTSKIESVIVDFINMNINELFFFILEIPAPFNDEDVQNSAFKKDVYYIDGITMDQCFFLLDKYGELLIEDGISSFGFGIFESNEEIMSEKYNIVTLYTNDHEKYFPLMEKNKIPRNDDLKTAYETFTKDSPGQCVRIEVNGKSVFDLPEELKSYGLYLAERRDD